MITTTPFGNEAVAGAATFVASGVVAVSSVTFVSSVSLAGAASAGFPANNAEISSIE